MSDKPDIAAARAIENVVAKLGHDGQLREKIRALDPSGNVNIQSCNATARVVMEAINDKEVKAGRKSVMVKPPWLFACFAKADSRLMTQDEMVSEIDNLLNKPIALYIQVSPDHHFVVLPTGGGHVGILQSFQDSYSLVDWLEHRGAGEMTKTDFITRMRNLVSGDKTKRETAAGLLFSFGGRSESDAKTYFGTGGDIKAFAYKDL